MTADYVLKHPEKIRAAAEVFRVPATVKDLENSVDIPAPYAMLLMNELIRRQIITRCGWRRLKLPHFECEIALWQLTEQAQNTPLDKVLCST